MKKQRIQFFFLLLILTCSCKSQVKEEQTIQELFDNYKAAILADDGVRAVKYVDSRTIKYYEDILNYTRSGDSIMVNSLPLLDKCLVFIIRHKIPKGESLPPSGKELFIYSINNGMVGKDGVLNNSIGKITLNKESEFAKGNVVVNGKEFPIYMHFYKEDSLWKIDITSLLKISTFAFKKAIDESGYSENEFIFSILEVMTGEAVNAAVWEKRD